MDIQKSFSSYIRRATKLYPKTISYYCDELLEKKVNDVDSSEYIFISSIEIKETVNYILQELRGFNKQLDNYLSKIGFWDQETSDDIYIVSNIIELAVLEEIKKEYEIIVVEDSMVEGGINIKKLH